MPQTKRFVIDVMRRMRVIPLLAVLAAVGVSAQQRVPEPLEPGSSAIRGKVVDAQSNEPMAGVQIGVLSVSAARTFHASNVRTAADGTYQFADIAAGRYSVGADLRSHLSSCCVQISLDRDQQRNDVNFRLTPGSTVRGRVVDTNGRPQARVRVRLADPPRRGLSRMAMAMPVVTKDDGRFEMTRVSAGEWMIEVDLPPSRDDLRQPVVYYPGVESRGAAGTIDLSAGETIDDVTIVVPSTLSTTITVRVSSPVPNAAASIMRAAPFLVRPVALNAQGVGTIRGLIEGRYFVAARGWSGGKAFAAFDVVDIARASREVSLRLRPAGRITGKIVARRGGLPPLAGVRVGAAWIHDDLDVNPLVPDQAEAAADGSFRIDGLFGKRQMQMIGLPADWGIQSVLQGRSNVTRGVTVPSNRTVDVTIVLAPR